MYYVKLTYFRSTGKYYSSGSFLTEREDLFDIWQEVEIMQREGKLPGLVEGAKKPIIWIKVPQHKNRHPHLIVNMGMET